jgi:hypothetical protein
MLGSLAVVTPPTGSVITVQQAINQARIDDPTDANIPLYIEAATQEVEDYLGKSLRVQTLAWTIAQTEPPNDSVSMIWGFAPLVLPLGLEYIFMLRGQAPIELPKSTDTTVVNSVILQDWMGNTQALTLNTNYEVESGIHPARVRIKNNVGMNQKSELITINYTTGLTIVPAGIQYAILLLVTHKYRYRGDDLESGSAFTHQAKRALDPYRSVSFGG